MLGFLSSCAFISYKQEKPSHYVIMEHILSRKTLQIIKENSLKVMKNTLLLQSLAYF